MRWIWIDSFVEFVPRVRASAEKCVTLAEEAMQDQGFGPPVFPPTLMIEGMAQTAGILVGESRGFSENVILAKIRRASFEGYAGPGDRLRYDAVVDSLDDQAAMTSGIVLRNGEPIGRVDLMFSHVNQAARVLDLPDHNFVFTEQFMSLYRSFCKSGSNEGKPVHGG